VLLYIRKSNINMSLRLTRLNTISAPLTRVKMLKIYLYGMVNLLNGQKKRMEFMIL
jgi:hypothetical protein